MPFVVVVIALHHDTLAEPRHYTTTLHAGDKRIEVTAREGSDLNTVALAACGTHSLDVSSAAAIVRQLRYGFLHHGLREARATALWAHNDWTRRAEKSSKGRTGKHVISFGLSGMAPKFTTGARENILLARWLFPGWVVRIYADESVAEEFKSELRSLGAEVEAPPPQLSGHTKSGSKAMFWRFLVAEDAEVDVYLIRDIDTRLSRREKAGVEEWLRSEARFYVIRDHPCHSYQAVMGGLWGGRARLKGLSKTIMEWSAAGRTENYMDDVDFLATALWPTISSNTYQHDSFSCARYGAFPLPANLHLPDQSRTLQVYNDTLFLHAEPFFIGETFFANGSTDSPNVLTWLRANATIRWGL